MTAPILHLRSIAVRLPSGAEVDAFPFSSPILLAFPGAAILDFDCAPPRWTDYANLEHVQITHAFLNNPERFLRRL